MTAQGLSPSDSSPEQRGWEGRLGTFAGMGTIGDGLAVWPGSVAWVATGEPAEHLRSGRITCSPENTTIEFNAAIHWYRSAVVSAKNASDVWLDDELLNNDREFRAAHYMAELAASTAHCVDAIYAAMKEKHAFEPRARKPDSRPSRWEFVVEAVVSSTRLVNADAKELKARIKRLYAERDVLVHASSQPMTPVLHERLGLHVHPFYADYQFHGETISTWLTTPLILCDALSTRPRKTDADHEFVRWAAETIDSFQSILSLGNFRVTQPSGGKQ